MVKVKRKLLPITQEAESRLPKLRCIRICPEIPMIFDFVNKFKKEFNLLPISEFKIENGLKAERDSTDSFAIINLIVQLLREIRSFGRFPCQLRQRTCVYRRTNSWNFDAVLWFFLHIDWKLFSQDQSKYDDLLGNSPSDSNFFRLSFPLRALIIANLCDYLLQTASPRHSLSSLIPDRVRTLPIKVVSGVQYYYFGGIRLYSRRLQSSLPRKIGKENVYNNVNEKNLTCKNGYTMSSKNNSICIENTMEEERKRLMLEKDYSCETNNYVWEVLCDSIYGLESFISFLSDRKRNKSLKAKLENFVLPRFKEYYEVSNKKRNERLLYRGGRRFRKVKSKTDVVEMINKYLQTFTEKKVTTNENISIIESEPLEKVYSISHVNQQQIIQVKKEQYFSNEDLSENDPEHSIKSLIKKLSETVEVEHNGRLFKNVNSWTNSNNYSCSIM